MPFIPFS